jgi:GLPGLI family protein
MSWQTDGWKAPNINSYLDDDLILLKNLLFASICILFLSASVQAQPKKSGAIQFESTFDPAAMATANGLKLSEQVLARMPKSYVTNFELLFNLTNASYMPVEDIEDSNNSGGAQSGAFRFGGLSGGNKEYYYNFAAHSVAEVFDLNDTSFVMEDKLGEISPQVMGMQQAPPVVEYLKRDETKNILGFPCHKVTVKTTVKRKIMEEEKVLTDETQIWYTDALGFDFSPNPALWTAGAVLAIEGKGTHVYAKSIEYRKVNDKDVNLPKKVVPITAEAYRAKMEARRKQFRGSRAGGIGGVRTITIN